MADSETQLFRVGKACVIRVWNDKELLMQDILELVVRRFRKQSFACEIRFGVCCPKVCAMWFLRGGVPPRAVPLPI